MMESQPLQDPTAEADGGAADPTGASLAVICSGDFRWYQEDVGNDSAVGDPTPYDDLFNTAPDDPDEAQIDELFNQFGYTTSNAPADTMPHEVGNDTAVGDPTPYDDWFNIYADGAQIDELSNQFGNTISNAPADTMPHEVVPKRADNTNQYANQSKLLVSAAYQGDSMLVNSQSHGFSTADQLRDAIDTNAGWMSKVQVLGLLNNADIFQLEDGTELCDSSDSLRRFGAVVTVSQSHLVGLPISHELYSSTGRKLMERGPQILKISGNSISKFVFGGNLWTRKRYTIDNTYHVLEWLPKPRDNQMLEFDDNRSGSASATQDIELVNAEKEEGKGKSRKKKGDNKRKEMASRSKMWDHFEKIKVGGILKKGQCKYCSREIKAESAANGTSALRNHFNICKCNPHKNKDSKQGTLQVNQGDSTTTWKFDLEALRNAFVEMVIEDELPFAFSEKSGLRKFISRACPGFSVPSRRTTARDIGHIYFQERAKLKNFLKDSCERVCLTTNYWTSQQQDSYMVVTAHFIDNDWKLHKKVIGFLLINGHKEDDIGKTLQKCLMEWGLEKVMTITVDNGSSYDGGINYLKRHMNNLKTCIAQGKFLHMRCVAHIINLIVSDGLKEVDISMKRVRGAIRYIKSGTSRLVKFKNMAKLEKVDSNADLSLDICTRWNTTYLMLRAAIKYEKVFARYEEEDLDYTLDLCGEKGHGVPKNIDWENAKKMTELLGYFYDLVVNVSSTLRVTANNFFHEIGIVHTLLQRWCDSDDPIRAAMGKRMKGKYDKCWGNWHEKENENENENEKGKGKEKEKENLNLLIFIAIVLDPRYKLSDYTKFAIEKIFGEKKGQKVWDAVNTCFHELFEEYRVIHAPSELAVQTNDSQQAEDRGGRLMKTHIAKKMRMTSGTISSNKTELEKYLSEDNEEHNKDLDILVWWKVNSSKFPMLARMARDVLAVPISTMALELAFSTGGHVLDDFRSSLTPFMVQAVVCTQDWLQRDTPINIEEDMEELAKMEEELTQKFGGANSSKSKSNSQASMSSYSGTCC